MDIKRVVCLYRVSTKMQVDADGDISLQRKACLEYINKQPGWVLINEYYERGVSGFRTKFKERDILEQILEDAANKKFDVLLVFKIDRLGRQDLELMVYVEELLKKGIEVHTTVEGKVDTNDHTQKLINFLRFWLAEGESRSTSVRVKEKHKQMVRDGQFRGGVPPYGYKLVDSGVVSKKGKPLKKLVIDEEEAKVVRLIYDLALNYGMGGLRIAKYLNELGIKPRKGDQWNAMVINYMLRNPIYKGYLTFGKTTPRGKKQGRTPPNEWILSDNKIEELVIIPEEVWDKVQIVRNSRTPDKYKVENLDYSQYPLQTKSPLLLTGLARCGYCGQKLTTGFNRNKWTTKDGVTHITSERVYKCVGKSSGKINCSGKYIYFKEEVEGPVLEEIYSYFEMMKNIDFKEEASKIMNENIKECEQQIKKIKKDIEKEEKDLKSLKDEVPKSIRGESSFKPDFLNSLIGEKIQKIETLQKELEKAEIEYKKRTLEVDDLLKLQKYIINWREEFERAPIEVKKMILADIIDEVIVFSDSIEVKMKMHVEDFFRFRNEDIIMQNQRNCRTNYVSFAREKPLKKYLKVVLTVNKSKVEEP